MSQIVLEGIGKRFSVLQRPQGRFAALRGVFRPRRKTIHALSEVSFAIGQGELVGYIGPNGAGKSTTVKVMSGILTPDEGDCRILGRVPWKERVAHVSGIGVVFGQRSQLWWDVPVLDSFGLLRDIYGIPAEAYKRRLADLTVALDLGPLLPTPVRQLSLGQRIRCEVAAALLHSPAILFLDEPTIGLDAVSKLKLRDFLREENRRRGVTMILTTHDMDDIAALCTRVMTIGKGRLLFDGPMENLKVRYAPLRRIRAKFAERVEAVPLDTAERVELDEDRMGCTLWFDERKAPVHVIIAGLAGAVPLRDMQLEEQNIDEIIAAMYREMEL